MASGKNSNASNTTSPRAINALVPRLLDWFAQHARDLPWRRTLDPYAIWISEIMLQQTQVKTVLAYWERWMRQLPDVQALAEAPPSRVLKLWEGLGYYTRARNLQKAATRIVSDHDGRFPRHFDQVLALPGIGRYTAGAICSIAFNDPAPILDGNVIRVLTRVFGIDRDPRENTTNAELWQLAQALVAAARRSSFSPNALPPALHGLRFSGVCSALNQSLMELGALVCTAKAPRCTQCPLRRRCVAFAQRRVAELPHLGRRARPTARRFLAFAAEYRGRWLVRQRPAGMVNAHLWELPNVEVDGAPIDPASLFSAEIGGRVNSMTPIPAIKHSITRYRILLEPFHVTLRSRPPAAANPGRWLRPEEVDALAFPSAHRKVWERIRAAKQKDRRPRAGGTRPAAEPDNPIQTARD